MEQLQQRLFQPLMKKMSLVVERIAKAEGFSIVLDRSSQQIIFVLDALDLTDRAAKEYDRS
jgi:Skp family chaperone for outer membrane proteins